MRDKDVSRIERDYQDTPLNNGIKPTTEKMAELNLNDERFDKKLADINKITGVNCHIACTMHELIRGSTKLADLMNFIDAKWDNENFKN